MLRAPREPLADRVASARLGVGQHRVLEVEDDRARAGIGGLVEALGPVARHEQIGEGMHQTALSERSLAMRSAEYPSAPRMASVCWPSAGTASMRGSPSSQEPGGRSAGIVPAGVSTSRQRL